MKEISLEEQKIIQLQMLKKVDTFCNRNGINYSLYWGTLLGAIRHKGYIPWDDDIDIMMPRPDYMRFVTTFNGIYPELTVYAPEIDKNYFETYANIIDNRTILFEEKNNHRGYDIGLKIDLIPFDGVPDDYNDYCAVVKEVKKIGTKLAYKKWTKQSFKHCFNNSTIKVFLITVFKCFKLLFVPYSSLQKRLLNFITSIPFSSANYVDNIAFPIYPNTRMGRSSFNEYVRVPFEDHYFPVIKDYDTLLKLCYGDYMTLPPEEKRVAHHGFTAYWK